MAEGRGWLSSLARQIVVSKSARAYPTFIKTYKFQMDTILAPHWLDKLMRQTTFVSLHSLSAFQIWCALVENVENVRFTANYAT